MSQRGAISVWMLPVIALLLAATLGVVTMGERVRDHWYQQNVADNMAISAATLLAREMNLLALLNRALIANQLSLAQVAGIASWYEMMQDVSERSALAASWVPYLNAITQNIARVIRSIEQPLLQSLRAILQFQRMVTTAIHATQWLARASFALEIPRTLTDIYALHDQANDSDWQVLHAPGLVPVPWLWWQSIAPHTSGGDAGHAREIMLSSFDPFSAERSYRWVHVLHITVDKAGGAKLHEEKSGQWHWQSMDTVSIHLHGLLDSEELPWGDGAAYLGQSIQRPVAANDFGASAHINSRATSLALAKQARLANSGAMFRYFNTAALEPQEWPQVIVKTAAATAKAGVYFSRPQSLIPRQDGAVESANLWNGLWQPQLQSLNTRDKTVLGLLLEQEQQ
ncbi:hypothetical protein IDAT_12345 [Pseudidiomarina atlantica]|uniref:Uncharacterized protein n=1 Tax=Pseudidiomarina atlantica TaxID=1517416 RepID=A0A094KZY7_9GAMM|nr:hypothetical protein [Pseudidiomarina atlantica]KFZ27868.1 hypothetical protein IDAT_12345 [Pseudidiomarina atlantica]